MTKDSIISFFTIPQNLVESYKIQYIERKRQSAPSKRESMGPPTKLERSGYLQNSMKTNKTIHKHTKVSYPAALALPKEIWLQV